MSWGFGPHAALSAQTGSWRPLPAGTHSVGFRVGNVIDETRPLANARGPRHVQISVWYPALRDATRHLTYWDYVALASAETTSVASASDSAKDYDSFSAPFVANGAPPAAIRQWLGAKMLATRDAEPSHARHPLVIIAQGNGESAHDQAVLAEYLASYGYVVATCPSQTRISGGVLTADDVGASAEEEASDLAFVIAQVRLRPGVNAQRIAVVGHSFGARGALLLAMRRPGIGALVSLDGGIGTATGLASFRAAPSFAPEAMHAPVLHIYETLDSFMTPDWTLLKSMHNAPVWIGEASAMHHHHFTSLGGLGSGYEALLVATGGTEATTRSFVDVATTVRGFLDARMGNTPRVSPAPATDEPPTPGALTLRRLTEP